MFFERYTSHHDGRKAYTASHLCLEHFLTFSVSFIHATAGADDGIEEIVTGGLVLRCLQTRTGIKFVITADKEAKDMDAVLREIYVLVSDHR
jgi:hypothetical protein